MNMAGLLKELQSYLYGKLVTDDQVLTSVQFMDVFDIAQLLKSIELPACVITPVGESHVSGPFANTARQMYTLRLVLIAQDWMSGAYSVVPVSGTPTNVDFSIVQEKIRLYLDGQKRLLTDTFEFGRRFDVTYFNTLNTPDNGNLTRRDIAIEYFDLELDTGKANDQDSLNPAYQFQEKGKNYGF